jgi:hypothetical protein
MVAWTAFVVLTGIFTLVVFISPSAGGMLELALGTLFLVLFFGLCGGIVWSLYVAYQLSVELHHGRLRVRSWLKIGPLGTDRTIDLERAEAALIRRPYYVEFQIPGATTRVWSMYRDVRDRDRFGTMSWFDSDYDALRAMLQDLGVSTEYRQTPTLLAWLTSR